MTVMRNRMCSLLALTLLASACKPTVEATAETTKSQLANARREQEHSLAADQVNPAQDSNLEAHAGIRSSYFDCLMRHESEALEIGYCISEEKEHQDKRLNDYYKELSKMLTTDQREQLIASQRAWLVFYGKEGQLQSAIYNSDQVSNLQVGENKLFMLCKRANQLKDYLDFVRD
ncbi:lysozyme inhibitor LprI family protein [Luteimonas sp. SX5]|uniref:Lysozyme inhibitor LprI family protein n=1 Tax=Luteimonas galliterrae TaxID=2940486 RepID=A0ABT0MLH0_9GAMM|nr:lysozyme inhibitor LprI family protein [Luteimonas galliterrae]MCL1635733.1 lysozyme inhibitor LprI family protein [Luteimonas galliterrae]